MTSGDIEPAARAVSLSRRLAFAEVAGGAFHDLNNALQVIGGLVELLERRTDLPEPVVAKLVRISQQSGRAAAAIAAVQELRRATTGRRVEVDLNRVVDEVVALRRHQLQRAAIAVEVRTGTTPARATADAALLRHAILVLLINAEQAVEGRPDPAITIEGGAGDDRVMLIVRDSGPGVAATIRDRLFEPWVSTKGPQAAGLGLWSARTVIEQMGGSLTLCEAGGGGRGAGFRLELPAVGTTAEPQATECSSASS